MNGTNTSVNQAGIVINQCQRPNFSRYISHMLVYQSCFSFTKRMCIGDEYETNMRQVNLANIHHVHFTPYFLLLIYY